LLESADQKEMIIDEFVADLLAGALDQFAPKDVHPDQWEYDKLKGMIFTQFGVDLQREGVPMQELNRQELGDTIFEKLKQRYDAKEKLIGAEQMRYHERMIMLSVLDGLWKDHLLGMDHLKEGIGLRGYGQHDPLVEYKKESFDMFEAMMARFQEETVRFLYLMQIIDAQGRELLPPGSLVSGEVHAPEPPRSFPVRDEPTPEHREIAAELTPNANGASSGSGASLGTAATSSAPRTTSVSAGGRPKTSMDSFEKEFVRKKQREIEQASMVGGSAAQETAQRRTGDKVGRNDPCPCGSGKKYKKCHGA